jgi:excisionase family DNA binding protein
MAMIVAERWGNNEDAAKHLGSNKNSVDRWVEEAALPTHQVGRLFRFKLAAMYTCVVKAGSDADEKHPPETRGQRANRKGTGR